MQEPLSARRALISPSSWNPRESTVFWMPGVPRKLMSFSTERGPNVAASSVEAVWPLRAVHSFPELSAKIDPHLVAEGVLTECFREID